MPNSLEQLRKANPVPDAALSDDSLKHSEATLARITKGRPTWTYAAAGVAVVDDLGRHHLPVCAERLFELRGVHLIAQVSDVQLLTHRPISYA